jgi:hypothetical protein
VATVFLALLAEAYGRMGQTGEGVDVLAETLAVVHTTGERFWDSELYRLKGQLLLQSRVQSLEAGVQKEAEECFQKASDIAR